jgi:hypothetical protein
MCFHPTQCVKPHMKDMNSEVCGIAYALGIINNLGQNLLLGVFSVLGLNPPNSMLLCVFKFMIRFPIML